MDSITLLFSITVAGIIVLLGLLGVGLHFVYRTVNSQPAESSEWTSEEPTSDADSDSDSDGFSEFDDFGEPDGLTVSGGTDGGVTTTEETGEFVFSNTDESATSGDSTQQRG